MDRVSSVSIDTATAIIRNCMTLMRVGDFRESVRMVVNDIILESGARNASIMLIDDEHRKAIKYCECLDPSIDMSEMPGDGNIPYEVVKAWQKMIGGKDSLIVRNRDERDESAKHSPMLAKMIERNKMETVCMLPLRRGDEVFGFFYVVNFDVEKADETKDLLEIMAFFIATEIFNNQLMAKLRRMSVRDELTGLYNRSAMISRMNGIVGAEPKPVGIVNMDLNGLKQINDTRGHIEGDTYLIHAAETMRRIFGDADVYRSGGDEFTVIIEGRSHEEFSGMVDEMRAAAGSDPDLSLAIGSYWSEDGLDDARTAFMHADKSMYTDKKRYYSIHPEFDRRGH